MTLHKLSQDGQAWSAGSTQPSPLDTMSAHIPRAVFAVCGPMEQNYTLETLEAIVNYSGHKYNISFVLSTWYTSSRHSIRKQANNYDLGNGTSKTEQMIYRAFQIARPDLDKIVLLDADFDGVIPSGADNYGNIYLQALVVKRAFEALSPDSDMIVKVRSSFRIIHPINFTHIAFSRLPRYTSGPIAFRMPCGYYKLHPSDSLFASTSASMQQMADAVLRRAIKNDWRFGTFTAHAAEQKFFLSFMERAYPDVVISDVNSEALAILLNYTSIVTSSELGEYKLKFSSGFIVDQV
jgi:hypothetical protein